MSHVRRVMIGLLVVMVLFASGWQPGAYAQPETGEAAEDNQAQTGNISLRMNAWAVLPSWSAAPEIDGFLDEASWSQAAVLDEFRTAFHQEPIDQDAAYRLAYGEGHLYVGGELDQALAETLSHIELVLRPKEENDSYYVVRLGINDDGSLNTIWNPVMNNINIFADQGKVEVEPSAFASSESGGRMYIEAAIPLNAIAPAGIAPGTEWHMNVIHAHQLYTHPFNSWIPIGNIEHWDVGGSSVNIYGDVIIEGRLGSLFFAQMPAQFGGASAAITELDQVELIYRGFNQKEVIFAYDEAELDASDLHLYWKEPGGDWQAVQASDFQQEGSVYSATFEHHDPVQDGIYELMLHIIDPNAGSSRAVRLSFDREHMIAAGLELIAGEQNDSEPVRELEWEEASSEVLEIMAMIPPQPGFRFVGLPEMPELYPDNLYRLSSDGQYLIADRTGTTYPNEQFAEDKELIVNNGKGELVSIPYYEDEDGNKYFITAHLWYLQKKEAVSRTEALAQLDPLGAARLLHYFAETYEGYNPTVDRIGGDNHITHSQNKNSGPPYAYWGGIWDRWWYNDLTTLRSLMNAYAAVKETNAFELLSSELGIDADQYVVDRMFLPSAEMVKTYLHRYSNMSFQPWLGLITLGKTIQEPDFIHYVVEHVERFVSMMFLSDGYWQEVTPSYHAQIASGLNNVLNALRGWSDPPGYVSPRTGKHFQDLDLTAQFPVAGRAIEVGNHLAYGNGKILPVMDAWANERVSRPTEGPVLLPGTKIGRLAGGEGADQFQVFLQFHPKYGHSHYDPLNLNLYAHRQELMPDIGYSHNSFYRYFTLSTIGHNTVVVDSADMDLDDASKHGGNIELFVAGDLPMQAMRASYDTAYRHVEEYSREPWFVPFADGDGSEGYVLDLFRVSGGDRHEYTLQGDANHEARFVTDMPLSEYGPYLLPPGTEVREPADNVDKGYAGGHYPGYIYVKEVQQAHIIDDRYELTLETDLEDGSSGAKMKITGLLDPGDHELYLGRSPSLRSVRLHGRSMDNNDEVVKYTMPKLVLRKDGSDLTSQFITVLEPYQGDVPRIEALDRLELTDGPEGAAAVKVIYGETTDILLSNPHHPDQPIVVDDIVFYGEMGLIRLHNGDVQEMMMAGGTLLRKGSHEITGSAAVRGTVLETRRIANGDPYDAFVTDEAVPLDVAGLHMIVTHPDQSTTGYKISQVLHEGGKHVIVLDGQDPGIEIYGDGTSEQTYYPSKRWSGEHVFEIKQVVHATDGWDEEPYAPELFAISLDVPKRHLFVGDTVRASVYGYMTDGSAMPPDAEVNVSSTDPNVVQVDEHGIAYAVGAGQAWLHAEASIGGVQRSDSLLMEVQVWEPELKMPPALHAKLHPVKEGKNVVLAFADDSEWRSNIQHVIVNGRALQPNEYQVIPGKIKFKSDDIFAKADRYWIVIHADGYRHAAADLRVSSAASLSSLTVDGKSVFPALMPGIDTYGALADHDAELISVTASVYHASTRLWIDNEPASSGVPHVLPFIGDHMQIVIETFSAADGLGETHSLHVFRGDQSKGAIAGIVFDPDGEPLPGAHVHLTGNTAVAATTDDEGRFMLSGVPAGRQRVTVTSSDAVRTVSALIDVQRDQLAEVAVSMISWLPPSIVESPSLGVVAEYDAFAVSSSRDSVIYFVPFDTPREKEAIEAAAAAGGISVQAEGGEIVSLDASALGVGKYVLYAIDHHDLISEGVPVVIVPVQKSFFDDDDPLLIYEGVWNTLTNSAYAGGTMKYARDRGSSVTIPFYGTSAQLITDRHTARGLGNIYVDGEYKATVDFYNRPILYQQVTFDTGPLEEGVHTIRIEALGEKNEEASSALVPFDGLRVYLETFQLHGVTEGPLLAGEEVQATSPRKGTYYLVPSSTPAERAAVEAAGAQHGKIGPADAGVAIQIDTADLRSGWYTLYVIDARGLLSEGSEPIAVVNVHDQPAQIEDQDPLVHYSGLWRQFENPLYSNGSMMLGFEQGAYVEIPFYGTSAVLVADLHRVRGKGRVYVNGEYQTTIDFYDPVIQYQIETFHTGELEEGLHVIRLETIWERHPDSTGYYASFDALRVNR